MTPHDGKPERMLLGGILAICLVFSIFHLSSPIAKSLGRGEVVSGALDLRGHEQASGKYLLFYSPLKATLDLVFVPASAPAVSFQQAAAAVGNGYFTSWKAPLGVEPGRPETVRTWVTNWPKDARFWLRFLKHAPRICADTGLSRYDLLLLAIEIFRADLRHVRLSWLPLGPALSQFLDWRLERASPAPPRNPLTAEIVNSSGETGLALQATKILREAGIDVVEFGTGPEILARSRFVDRIGTQDPAFRVADLLMCPAPNIVTELDLLGPASVSIVLGTDFRECAKLGPKSHSQP